MKKLKALLLKLSRLFKRKNDWRQKLYLKIKRHRWLFFVIFLIMFAITYLSISLFSVSQARLKLLELQKNLVMTGPCHEDCLLYREKLKRELAINFKTDKRLQADIKDLLLKTYDDNYGSNLAFKTSLLEIIASASDAGSPPDFIVDYLLAPESPSEIKAEIIKLFLIKADSPVLIDYYFSILNSSEPEIIKAAAVQALSNVSDKKEYFQEEQITILKNLIISGRDSLNLRADLLFLLTDFYQFFPKEAALALQDVYDNSEFVIIKAFAADSLNKLGFLELVPPATAPDDWNQYFNN